MDSTPPPLTRHHYSRDHRSSRELLTFQSPPPDASEISPASSGSSGEISPQSTVRSTASASSMSDSASSSPPQPRPLAHTVPYRASSARSSSTSVDYSGRRDAPIRHVDPHGSEDLPIESPLRPVASDFPLVSRAPSRGNSKSTCHSFERVAKHGHHHHDDSRQHAWHHERGKSTGCDISGTTTNTSRSSSIGTSITLRRGLEAPLLPNAASRMQYYAEVDRRRKLDDKEQLWRQHVSNRLQHLAQKRSKLQESISQHRHFNVQVRQLQRVQQGMPSSPSVSFASGSFAKQRTECSNITADDVARASVSRQQGGGFSMDDLYDVIVSRHVHDVIPRQLVWIGQSGDAGRQSAPPMLANHHQPGDARAKSQATARFLSAQRQLGGNV